MSDIVQELYMIKYQSRGEGVRDAFISACNKIADSVLPTVTTADVDKVLTVNSSGEWGVTNWQT